MTAAAHVTAQGLHAALLHGPRPGEQRQQARLAHAVRAEQSDHAPGWDVERDVVQRHDLAVAQTDVDQTGHRCGRIPSWWIDQGGGRRLVLNRVLNPEP